MRDEVGRANGALLFLAGTLTVGYSGGAGRAGSRETLDSAGVTIVVNYHPEFADV